MARVALRLAGRVAPGLKNRGLRMCCVGFELCDEGPGLRREAHRFVVAFDVADAAAERLFVEAVTFVAAGGPDRVAGKEMEADGVFGAFGDARNFRRLGADDEMEVPDARVEGEDGRGESRGERAADNGADFVELIPSEQKRRVRHSQPIGGFEPRAGGHQPSVIDPPPPIAAEPHAVGRRRDHDAKRRSHGVVLSRQYTNVN